MLNTLKFGLMLRHAENSRIRWQQEWYRYISECHQSEQFESDWNATDMVYGIVVPFSRLEYIGETRTGLRKRGENHVRKIRSKTYKGHMVEVMRKVGTSKMIFYPVAPWARRTTKRQRLHREAEHIWERQPSLNTVGMRAGNEERGMMKYGHRIVLGRIGRFSLFMRLRKKQARARENTIDTLEVRKEGLRERERRMKLFPMIINLSRRPIKGVLDFDRVRVVRELRAMREREVSRIIRLSQQILDKVRRSIFNVNLKKILEPCGKVLVLGASVRSAVFGMRSTEMEVIKAIKDWAKRWRRCGITVMVKLRTVAAGAFTMMSILNNITRKAGELAGTLGCMCAHAPTKARRLGGHVLHPLLDFVGNVLNEKLPRGWTALPKLCPGWTRGEGKIKESLSALHVRALKLVKMRGNNNAGIQKMMPINWSGEAGQRALERWKAWRPKCLEEAKVRGWKKMLEGLICCPVGKYNVDGMVLCPRMWAAATAKLGANLRDLTPEEGRRIQEYFYRLGETLGHLPFGRLRSGAKHRFGAVRAWIKFKSVKQYPNPLLCGDPWGELRWRPLVSYTQHHWKRVLGLAGRFCSFSTTWLGIGHGCTDVRAFVNSLNVWNERQNQKAVRITIWDLQEFFSNVGLNDLKAAVDEVICRIREKMPNAAWF